MDYFSEECEHASPSCNGYVGRYAHTRLCLISGGLHSWKSQNYASHTWFSRLKEIVVADYTPDQRTQYQHFYRNVHKYHISLILKNNKQQKQKLNGALYKVFQRTLLVNH